jgi:hypothetical protein
MNFEQETEINRWNDPAGFENPTADPVAVVASEADLPLPPAPAEAN